MSVIGRSLPDARGDCPPALEARGLTKRFGGITVVDSVDLVVPKGRIVGLIGHNGAGKTTVFDLLSGFLAADAGTVRLGRRRPRGRRPRTSVRPRASAGRSRTRGSTPA